MRDGVHRGGMPARARTHQVDGIRRARHRILEKGMGQLCRGSPEARPCRRAGKTSIPNTVYNSRRAIAAASRGAGTGTPHCARVRSGRFAGRAAAGSAFVSGQAAANPGGISGKPAARNAHFFRRRLSGHAFLAAVCIGYQRFCAAWAAACCKARICCA